MPKCRKYAIICLSSLLLLFSNSFIFYSSLISAKVTAVFIEQNDVTDSENEGETEIPIQVQEEEMHKTHHFSRVEFVCVQETEMIAYLALYWESIALPIHTPPPEKICV